VSHVEPRYCFWVCEDPFILFGLSPLLDNPVAPDAVADLARELQEPCSSFAVNPNEFSMGAPDSEGQGFPRGSRDRLPHPATYSRPGLDKAQTTSRVNNIFYVEVYVSTLRMLVSFKAFAPTHR
jgi:hypothetical protein